MPKKITVFFAAVMCVLIACTACKTEQVVEHSDSALSKESAEVTEESISAAAENTIAATETATSISYETIAEKNTVEEPLEFINALNLTNAVEARSEPETDTVYKLWQSEDENVCIYGVVLVPADDENRYEDDKWYMIIEHNGMRDFFAKRWYSWYTRVLMDFSSMTDDNDIIFVSEYAGHGMGGLGFLTEDMYLFELNENGHYEIIRPDKNDIIEQIKNMSSAVLDKDNSVAVFEAGDTKLTDEVDIAGLREAGYTEEEIDNCVKFFEYQWTCQFDSEKIIVNTAYLVDATPTSRIPHEFFLNAYINYADKTFTVEKCEFYSDN